jgi:RNA polymerase sigma-70 factor, ECF subfamily
VKSPEDQDRDLRNREFMRLLAQHDRQLAGYVHALIPSWQDAEDVLQETKLRLWEQFDSFRPNADFSAWAIAVATFMVRAYRTRCQRQRVCFSDSLLEKIARSIPTTPSKQDVRVLALVDCVKALSSASRKLLSLACLGQRKLKDIAGELGQTPSATYVALFRIRRSLLECVEKRVQKEEGR